MLLVWPDLDDRQLAVADDLRTVMESIIAGRDQSAT